MLEEIMQSLQDSGLIYDLLEGYNSSPEEIDTIINVYNM